ncbi:hypothetical protein GCM10027568_22970 [Humibacter soli]
MGVLHAADSVALWMDGGRPVRMVWQGRRYVVTDSPTPLPGDEVLHPALTHPLRPLRGWRFQVTCVTDPEDVHVVDVVRDGDRWELLAAYE